MGWGTERVDTCGLESVETEMGQKDGDNQGFMGKDREEGLERTSS